MQDYLINDTKVEQIEHIRIDLIRSNPYQPRRIFDMIALSELAKSISQVGIIQPIVVRPLTSVMYELVSGERRLRASRLAGLESVPCIVKVRSNKESAEIALIENLQRQDLHFLEEANGYQNLIDEYDLTQEELAKRLGKNQSTVANKLRLLRLPEDAKRLLQKSSLTERHARALLRLHDEKALYKILQKAIESDLTVKRTEELIEIEIEKQIPGSVTSGNQNVKRFIKDLRLFTNSIKQSVVIMKDAGFEVEESVIDNEQILEIHIKLQKQP